MRRAILLLAAALIAWACVVSITGGFVLEFAWGRLSSRAAIRPLIGAGLLLLLYAVRFRQHWHADIGRLKRVSPPHVIVAAALGLTLTVGLFWGTRIAGGPDASGYVSEAALFARGELRAPLPEWVDGAPWTNPAFTAAPVGYRPAHETKLLAPTYSPGLPLIMAAFQRAAGPDAVFYVVPILGAVAVWATWLIGKDLGDVWAGAIAAVLVATSPAFLIMLVQPVSDVPATALWALCLAAALRGQEMTVAAAATAAILVRPNIVPLVGIPLLVLLSQRRFRRRTTLAVAAAVVPGPLAIAWLNWFFYGSPLRSGYGTIGELFGFEQVGSNAELYRTWFFSTQSPLPLLGLIAPAVVRRGRERLRVLLVTTVFPVAVLCLYLPYQLAYNPEEWPYLRFLLPGYPVLMTGFALVVLGVCRHVRHRMAAAVLAVVVAGAVCAHGWTFARQNHVFYVKEAGQRYARAVAHARSLPQNAVLLSLAHSGTLRFYTGRDILQFESIPREDIDTALRYLEARGHTLYLIGDPFEIDLFRTRFAGTAAAARLDRAQGRDLGGVMVYALTLR